MCNIVFLGEADGGLSSSEPTNFLQQLPNGGSHLLLMSPTQPEGDDDSKMTTATMVMI